MKNTLEGVFIKLLKTLEARVLSIPLETFRGNAAVSVVNFKAGLFETRH